MEFEKENQNVHWNRLDISADLKKEEKIQIKIGAVDENHDVIKEKNKQDLIDRNNRQKISVEDSIIQDHERQKYN